MFDYNVYAPKAEKIDVTDSDNEQIYLCILTQATFRFLRDKKYYINIIRQPKTVNITHYNMLKLRIQFSYFDIYFKEHYWSGFYNCHFGEKKIWL